tara:strand:+ start:1970 stop:2446 length:477 start_codon:yes stop_codon:yes gene_type:complete
MYNLSLPTITTSAIIVDTIIGYYLLISNRGGKYIKEWYKTFTIGAYAMDILSIIIGTFIAVSLTNNIYKQLLLVVIVGLIHDISFGLFLNKFKKNTPILNIFRNYANELGITILIVDALMLISTILIAYLLKDNLSINTIIFIGILFLYLGLLMVYSF